MDFTCSSISKASNNWNICYFTSTESLLNKSNYSSATSVCSVQGGIV